MAYYAIDLDRNRVYDHDASGGFPADEYRPNADGHGEIPPPKLKGVTKSVGLDFIQTIRSSFPYHVQTVEIGKGRRIMVPLQT